MKTVVVIASTISFAILASLSAPAQAKSAKECAAQWKEMKAANQTNGMKHRDFTKQCMAEGAPPAAANPPPAPPAPPAAETNAPPPPAATAAPAGKTGSPGRQAYLARLHACSAEWKAAKAAGTRPAGVHWPQFWHGCDERKKAEGM